jgi:excisionase family DNA binding protein
MDKLLLTPPEAAMMLGIGRTKLYELIRSGELVSITIDRARRIPKVAAEAYVARRCGLPVHNPVDAGEPEGEVAVPSVSTQD